MKISARLAPALHAAWQSKGLISNLLWPASWLVRLAIARKKLRYRRNPELSHHSGLPVIVVGNIYIGGTGKTPVVIALARALQARGWHPGIISRGYGARIGDKPRTGQGQLDPALFGDEPALIAQATQAPVSVHPRRVLALKRLQRDYPQVDVVIADDGLQHLALGRDLEVVVQDGRGVGNRRVLPAGPLREPAARLEYVDFVITNVQPGETVPKRQDTLARQLTMQLSPGTVTQLTTGKTMAWSTWLAAHEGQVMSAVAAIGRPERFFAMLRHAGVSLSETVALPDHDAYASPPFADLPGRCILITSKDAVKCRRFNDPRLWVVHAEPCFSDAEWLDHMHEMLGVIGRQKTAMAARQSSV